jgi:hypothetical protein
MDDRFGPVVYSVTGTFDGATVEFKGKATQQPDGIQTGDVEAKGALTPEGQLRGAWSSTLGTGGTFQLLPHDFQSRPTTPETKIPEQLHTALRTVGAIRLYADDVKQLISAISKDFTVAQVIANYHENGNERSKYATDFEAEFARLKELRFLRLHVQEPEAAHNLVRMATIELNASGANTVRVQGIQESWVIGKAESLTMELRKFQKFFPTAFNKYGLNFNTLLLLGALVLIPELPWGRRTLFVGVVAGVIAVNIFIHARFIPNALIYLSARQPSFWSRAMPQIGSTLLAVSSTLVTGIIFALLKGEIEWPWLAAFFSAK